MQFDNNATLTCDLSLWPSSLSIAASESRLGRAKETEGNVVSNPAWGSEAQRTSAAQVFPRPRVRVRQPRRGAEVPRFRGEAAQFGREGRSGWLAGLGYEEPQFDGFFLRFIYLSVHFLC